MAEGRGKKFLKYFLMSSNAFGLMIGIFVVLFGMAYPGESMPSCHNFDPPSHADVGFPGGHKGKETAIYASVFIFFTLIGYCGVSSMCDSSFSGSDLLTATSFPSLVRLIIRKSMPSFCIPSSS